CQAGTLYRPVRERPVEEIVEQALANLAATGYEEMGLLSLSTSDYGPLPELLAALHDALRGRGVNLAFPSLRPDSFTREMARSSPEGRKGGLTFAPEAGTQRLRDVINKNTSEEDLLRAAKIAFEEGFTGLKLYFMCGLPTETKADLDGIAHLVGRVARLRTSRRQRITISVSPFSPKPHTPFQWYGQQTPGEVRERLAYLRERFRGVPVRFTAHNPESALYESALARGDRRLGRVVERVWRNGGVLEAWHDHFDPERWAEAFRAEKLDPEVFVRGRTPGGRLPWSHIDKGVTERYQTLENRRAMERKVTPDCREGRCTGCGLTEFFLPGKKVCNLYPSVAAPITKPAEGRPPGEVVLTARVRYRRGGAMRWTGHLDLVRLWDRALRRGGVPVAFSRGFHPHPRIAFAPPLPVGIRSEDEYVDLELSDTLTASDLLSRLRRTLPAGLEPLEAATFREKLPSLSAQVERMEYLFRPREENGWLERMDRWLAQPRCPVRRRKRDRVRTVDLRPFVEEVERRPEGDWRLRLRLENGTTARLDELAEAWGLEERLGGEVTRLAMLVPTEKGWRRPIEAAAGQLKPVSRAGGRHG
ncbi:MAG TPA: DUF2344 domain-containing protein, partial [Bacteroidetes bacterium]|nr:DUF2344 domain-containing protein [Bacteroidota bacterium]